ncbi:hypothetical protein KKH23_10745 [Patescibacteria group bacterium]|nr:hypothetical protein [Patescibacteria group bacterium]
MEQIRGLLFSAWSGDRELGEARCRDKECGGDDIGWCGAVVHDVGAIVWAYGVSGHGDDGPGRVRRHEDIP